MEGKDPQGIKIPLIFIGVATLVIAVGIFVRSRNSSPSQPPESQPAPAPEPTSALETESGPIGEQSPEPEPEPQIRFSSLAATDDNGNNWRLGLRAIPPQVPEGATDAGEPLLVRADVRGAGRYISIGLVIQGQAGEIYEPGAARNGRLMPAPTFKVFDESGKTVGSGSFEYG
jgi:hypothetical protein